MKKIMSIFQNAFSDRTWSKDRLLFNVGGSCWTSLDWKAQPWMDCWAKRKAKAKAKARRAIFRTYLWYILLSRLSLFYTSITPWSCILIADFEIEIWLGQWGLGTRNCCWPIMLMQLFFLLPHTTRKWDRLIELHYNQLKSCIILEPIKIYF